MSPDGETLIDTLIDTLLKPSGSIPQDASAINGITDEMVVGAPLFTEIYLQLCQVLTGKLIIAYNADFDERMLLSTCTRYKVSYKEIFEARPHSWPWRCAMIQYAAYVGEWDEYWVSYRWQKLPKGNHTAKGDCQATLELIKRMAESELV